jgi:hypothetical protein
MLQHGLCMCLWFTHALVRLGHGSAIFLVVAFAVAVAPDQWNTGLMMHQVLKHLKVRGSALILSAAAEQLA